MNDDEREMAKGWAEHLKTCSVPALLRAARGTLNADRRALEHVGRSEGDVEFVQRMIIPLVDALEQRADELEAAPVVGWPTLEHAARGNA
jgi:hypothetical protein